MLRGVLQHIDFNRTVGKSKASDKKLRQLIDHFNRYGLLNDDFEFPDLLGAAYEYLVGEFADSAGKKGGEFYTPRAVIRMMVRLAKPRASTARLRLYGIVPRRFGACTSGCGFHSRPGSNSDTGRRFFTALTVTTPGRCRSNLTTGRQDRGSRGR